MSTPDGAQHLGVFVALIEIVASLPITARDGRLVNLKGVPLSIAALSVKSRIPAEKIEQSIEALKDCGWIITDDEFREIPGDSRKFPANPGGEGEEEGEGEAKSLCASGDARACDSSLVTVGEKPKHAPSVKKRANANPQQAAWFETFWAAYWLRRARKPALIAFVKAVKSPAHFEAVMAAVRAQSEEMLRREPQHRPHAASWLNAERWNDSTEEKKSDSLLDQLYKPE